jgi:hypothetical protein
VLIARAVSRSVPIALLAACLVAVTVAPAPAAAQPAATRRLDFNVQIGSNTNYFVRDGAVAAHLVLRSGSRPRILVAFPAGNSGVGLWFAPGPAAARWTVPGPPQPARAVDARGRPLYGITAHLSIATRELRIRQAVLSSIRVLRDYEQKGSMPPSVSVAPTLQGRTISWARDRLDGAAGYRLTLEVTDGALQDGTIVAGADGRIALTITALSGEMPLTPLGGAQLLSGAAGPEVATRDTLTFLAYREKFLAGSWRFDTYFGRDTLIAARLLMPALSAPAMESALSSVLARLSPMGEVAHEEDIGERAVLDHLERDGSRSAAPVYDYKMIDSDYLLAPVASAWLLHDARGRAGAAAFLAGSVGAPGERRGSRGAALAINLRLVLKSAGAFVADPVATHLIGLKPGQSVGEWRDSDTGLGGGRYPYDVNAVLVPAALTAAAQLSASGLLNPYLGADDRALFARAANMAELWRTRAPPLFDVVISHRQARGAVERYSAAQAIAPGPALAALGNGDVRFHALALTAAGDPIPVMNSDEGFAFSFAEPPPDSLDRAVTALMRPFPAGLMTEVGMVVANPAYCAPALQGSFSRNAYHGTVVWSWQQALFAAGLARQLERQDLPSAVREHLVQAQELLWSAIEATRSMNDSELWSWSFADGHYRIAPFGAAAADADESNAAQLWSTVYLAVRPPREVVP